ncbi:hypothetical protein I8H89_00295 [Candidatus Saccharibacteria bacterium]|nr:hypothetical protein [Candidatus Saccharibacteria bacterium]
MSDWSSGTVSALDDRRTPVKGLRSSGNVILAQDSVITPRPSLTKYGPQPIGKILGEIGEFRVTTGATSEYWMITLQNVSGTTRLYIAKGEDTTWTLISGKTYHVSAGARFVQIGNKVLVLNGEDYLSYLDTPTMTIIAFTALSNPAAPTLDTGGNTGLTGTNFKVYYAVTANSTVGETAGSPAFTQQVSIDRDMWNPDTQSIRIKWTTVTNVKSWNIYMGVAADGAGQPQLYLIASGIDATTLTFTDNGTKAQDLARPLPTSNSTSGPRCAGGKAGNGRVWLVRDKDNPFWVWRGGDYNHEVDFSPAYGGGYTPIGSGTKEVPIQVIPYRDGKGDPRVTVLSQGTNGGGKRYLLSPQTITYGASSFIVWKSDEDSGGDGTDSPDGVLVYNNSLHYPSRDGFKTTGTLPQLQNVLSTNRTSNTIWENISTLRTSAMSKCVGMAYEGRLYWSLPVASTTNNEVWVLDLDRKGAWMRPWSIPADWMMLYNDNNGNTHPIFLVNNVIYELNKGVKTSDGGRPFATSGQSGQILFSDDGREWARLIKVVVTLLRPQGEINFTVVGNTEDGRQPFYFSDTFGGGTTRAGWSDPLNSWSNPKKGWSEITVVPKILNEPSIDVEIEVDEDVQWFQYGWNSTGPGVDYAISNVVAEYVNIGLKESS